MTRDAVLEELLALMNEEPAGKAGVAFILLQIRKVLEHQGKPDGYWTLNFFCDWIAHTRLCGTGALKILKILDDRLMGFDARSAEIIDSDGMVMSILSFDLLRRELRAFLNENRLPTRWTDDDFTWQDVVRLYGQQVRDIPLVVTSDKYGLKHIRRIEIVGFESAQEFARANPGETYYGFDWVVTLKDGRRLPFRYTSNVIAKPENR
jgi:hypothetical protein